MTEEELLNKSFDGNLIPHPHMTEDERAEMFYKECMDTAGIKDYPPLSKEDGDEIESSLDFLSHYDS